MAQVTFSNPQPVRHIFGDCSIRFFVVNGATGSTLNTGLTDILWVDPQAFTVAGTASLITAITVNYATGVITFTSSAPMVTEVVQVISRVG